MYKVFRSAVLATSVVLLGAGSLHALTATGCDPVPKGKKTTAVAVKVKGEGYFTATGCDPVPRTNKR
jgi:hypothetical protein